MFIVDAHLDLAYNAVGHGRNLLQSVTDLRAGETSQRPGTPAITTFPELQRGGVGLVFGTLFCMSANSPIMSEYSTLIYRDAATAHRLAMKQLDYYHRLADESSYIRIVADLDALNDVLASHQSDHEGPKLVGIVPLMEGADPIQTPDEAEVWYERGLRAVGLAWDDTRYSAGAWRGTGGLTRDGFRLLEALAAFQFIVDITHMSEQASVETLERYEGPVVATHSNARALVPTNRQLSDDQIRLLGERDGVIGIAMFNAFLRPDHRQGDPKSRVTLEHIIAHIDHICQVLGSANHVGIGSDFDGGFGAKDIPLELDTVADLPLIASSLRARGYQESDVNNIMGGNWCRLLRRTWS